jgi:hypothetical protein
MPANISSLAPMSVTPESGSSTILATEVVGITLGIMSSIIHHSGNIYQTLVVIPGADRRVRISTPFAGAFALFGLGLKPCTALNLYLAKFSDFNRLTTGLSITLGASAKAAVQISGWHVNVDGILMADLDVIFISPDGIVDPFVLTDAAALPAITGTPALHTLGPVSFNIAGTPTIIPGVISSGGTIGSQPTLLRTDGDFFGRTAARMSAQPVISITHADPEQLLDSLTQLGLSYAGNTVVYFRSYDPTTGINEATGGISMTMAAGRMVPHNIDESSNVVASTSVDIIGISTDGNTAAPIVVATNVTVPSPP